MPSWTQWKRIPGGFRTDAMPSVGTSWTQKKLYVVARNPKDNTIWYNIGNETLTDWAGWAEVPGHGTTLLAPTISGGTFGKGVVTGNDNSMAVLAVGLDNGVYLNRMSLKTGAWSGWLPLGGRTDAPVLGFDATCSFRCFARGIGDSGVYMKEYFPNETWSDWTRIGGLQTDFTITPSRPEFPAHRIMALLAVRQSDRQVCLRYLDYADGTGGPSGIEAYPKGWNPLPYSAKTNAPLAAALTRGFAGFAKGGSDGKIYALTEKDGASQVPGGGITNAGLSAATMTLSRTQKTSQVVTEFVRNVLAAKGVEDGEVYLASFDDEFDVFHLDAF